VNIIIEFEPEPEEVDESDPSGLTEEAYLRYTQPFSSIVDVRPA